MPTENRIEGVIVELCEKIEILGDNVLEVVGPEEHEDEDGETQTTYYIFGETSENSSYYITLGTRYRHGTVVYPFSIAKYIGRQVGQDDIETILGESIDWEQAEGETIDDAWTRTGEYIIENSDIADLWTARFNLSVYANTALVDYDAVTNEHQFPTSFRCNRNIFPYTEQISLSELDDRTQSVVIAGKRGKRYVEASLAIEDGEDPKDYTLKSHF